jgi:DNA-binding NarL/FixJ family response regulator
LSQPRALVAVAAELQQQVIDALDGWELHVSPDGEDAIGCLWEASPDLVVIDFDLPRMTAYDLVRHLCMRRPELLCRTLILVEHDDAARALLEDVAIGCTLEKPFDADSFARAAESCRTSS